MSIKHIKKNDTEPCVRVVLSDVDTVSGGPPQSSPVDLTGATIKFIMCRAGEATPKVDATLEGAELVDLANGEVEYQWDGNAGDTDTEGNYLAEFQVTDVSGRIKTYWDERTAQEIEDALPPDPIVITIVGDLA